MNLPETQSGRWGQGLTADKMKNCVWLKPKLVGQFEFVEWTADGFPRALFRQASAWLTGTGLPQKRISKAMIEA